MITIGVFGSYVRGDQDSKSDLDMLVEVRRPVGFVKFIRLENHLSQLLGVKVDLVTKKALKPHIGRRILRKGDESYFLRFLIGWFYGSYFQNSLILGLPVEICNKFEWILRFDSGSHGTIFVR